MPAGRAGHRTEGLIWPIGNGAVGRQEDLSFYLPVAKLTALPQETYSPARRIYVDGALSSNPWYALAAHRPLVGITRVRRTTYEAARVLRARMNACPIAGPHGIEELPE